MVEVRHCHCPGHEGPAALPATSDYFIVKMRDGKPKTDTFCRKCRLRQRADSRSAMQDAAKKLIISKSLGSRKTPHFDDLLDEVYRRIGGHRRLAKEIASYIKDENPKNQVNRRTVAMKVFDATQKRTEAEETNEIKKAATANVKAELRALLDAAGIDLDELDDLEEAERALTVDEPLLEAPDEDDRHTA